MEVSAITSTLEGWRMAVSATVVAIGALLVSCFLLDYASSRTKDVFEVYRVTGYGMQFTYTVVVLVAASEDWKHLLWLLPEVPFETISLCCLD